MLNKADDVVSWRNKECIVLVGIPLVRQILAKLRMRWDFNTEIDMQELGCEDVY
jgi:hypothetical protein